MKLKINSNNNNKTTRKQRQHKSQTKSFSNEPSPLGKYWCSTISWSQEWDLGRVLFIDSVPLLRVWLSLSFWRQHFSLSKNISEMITWVNRKIWFYLQKFCFPHLSGYLCYLGLKLYCKKSKQVSSVSIKIVAMLGRFLLL